MCLGSSSSCTDAPSAARLRRAKERGDLRDGQGGRGGTEGIAMRRERP
jgi:hypothetical protein